MRHRKFRKNWNFFQQKIIDGHAPSLRGNDLMAYAAGGISSDHECSNAEEAFERLNAGMYVMLREGSAAKEFTKYFTRS